MARLSTIGFDIEGFSGRLDGLNANGSISLDSTVRRTRSGPASLKCDSGAGNVAANTSLSNQSLDFAAGGMFAAAGTYFCSAYFCFSNLPSADALILRYSAGANAQVGVRVRTDGKIALWNEFAGTQIGSDSAAAVAADGQTWYMVDLSCVRASTSSLTTVEARLNGVVVASGNVAQTATVGSGVFAAGWMSAPGANCVLNVDDLAVNDAAGSSETSYPGPRNIVLLVPVSDSARGANWLGGAGGTTNLWDALNNQPPVGVAFNGTDTSQVRNAASDSTGNYDANLTTYTDAGITANDTITLVHPLWALGCNSATATNIARLLVSNPQSNGGTESTQSTGVIAGTYPSNWKQPNNGTHIVYGPSVTLGTSPVIRVGKRTAATRVVGACFMGVYVEFVAAKSLSSTARTARNSLVRM